MMASQLLPLTLSSVLFFSLILHVYHALNRPGFIPVKTYGDTDPNARKVILIPGLDGCTSFYADTLPELTAQGYSVVMFHIPLAPRPWPLNQLYALIDPANERQPGDHGEYTFEFMAAQLLQQMVVLGIDKADIVGESFGGVIALHFALAYPDRVDRLVLISSLAKTELTPAVQFKATFALPVVRAFGMLFPGAAQTLFALLHTDDVVEAHEPLWLKRMFQVRTLFI